MNYTVATSLGLSETARMRKSMWTLWTLKLNCLFQGKSIDSDIYRSPQNKCLEEWLSEEMPNHLFNLGCMPHARARLSAGLLTEWGVLHAHHLPSIHPSTFELDPCLPLKLSAGYLHSSPSHLIVSVNLFKLRFIPPCPQEEQWILSFPFKKLKKVKVRNLTLVKEVKERWAV